MNTKQYELVLLSVTQVPMLLCVCIYMCVCVCVCVCVYAKIAMKSAKNFETVQQSFYLTPFTYNPLWTKKSSLFFKFWQDYIETLKKKSLAYHV